MLNSKYHFLLHLGFQQFNGTIFYQENSVKQFELYRKTLVDLG